MVCYTMYTIVHYQSNQWFLPVKIKNSLTALLLCFTRAYATILSRITLPCYTMALLKSIFGPSPSQYSALRFFNKNLTVNKILCCCVLLVADSIELPAFANSIYGCVSLIRSYLNLPFLMLFTFLHPWITKELAWKLQMFFVWTAHSFLELHMLCGTAPLKNLIGFIGILLYYDVLVSSGGHFDTF